MMFLARLAVARPFAVLAALVLVTAVFASRLPSLAVDDEILNMIPADHPARVLQERIERDFGVRDVAVLAIENDGGIFNPSSLARVARLTEFLQGLPGVVTEDVASLSATDNVVAEKDALLMRAPLSREGVSAEQARAVADEVLDNPLFTGRLVSADGKVAAIYAPLAEGATRESVYAAVTKHLATLPAPDNSDRILVAGKVMVEGGLGAAMRADLRRLGPVVVAVLLVLLWAYFRHPLLALLPVLTAIVPVVWTLGLMAWLGIPIYVPTTLVPVILLIIGITEEVHLIGEYRRLGRALPRRTALLAALDAIKRPVTFMTLTTAIGFASPAASPILPLTYFGLFTAFGIGVAYLLTFTFTPAVLSLFNALRTGIDQRAGLTAWGCGAWAKPRRNGRWRLPWRWRPSARSRSGARRICAWTRTGSSASSPATRSTTPMRASTARSAARPCSMARSIPRRKGLKTPHCSRAWKPCSRRSPACPRSAR